MNGEEVKVALSIFNRVKAIKESNPKVSQEIERLEKEIRERLIEIKKQINTLKKDDRDLITVLVIQGLHRTSDEIFID